MQNILLYRPVEAYGVRMTLKWQPYSHYFHGLPVL